MTSTIDRPLRASHVPQSAACSEGALQLRSLREAHRRSVIERLAGPVVTALYVLVRPGQDPAARLAVARATAARCGYTVADVLVDDAWRTDPALRPRLARAHAALHQGRIHGLVAASRVDVSSDDGLYEQELRRLRGAGGFLHLAHDEFRF
ncbi:hypothetical protein [Streptomyces sp. bgisy153]|uniref:hypothetical protein n=1 Tax=Streptomyces sp. bgisy153 TaxID=3413793 RepID=UPI003D7052EA